ncbi:MAG: DSD1 family PLP-dependent enzyme [bacterium]|jgi:D-serine deaminase-like pyridoxal phosphate-dependent protein|nr:DSD1 family PLP-dependent enzyme [Betaproteobacteria bacterium]
MQSPNAGASTTAAAVPAGSNARSADIRAPARIGDPLSDIDTPALIVDLDAFERNIARMAARVAAMRASGGNPALQLRPHAKTHKSPDIAARQVAAGAVGVCVQKVAEAEALVDGGVADVLVSNEVVGRAKLARLAALARRARLSVCVDHPDNVRQLSAAMVEAGATIDVLVEIDVGAGRCGVPPGEPAAALASQVAASPGLCFAGLQAYHGSAQHLRTVAERQQAIAGAVEKAARTRTMIEALGIAVPKITGAGTGTFEIEGASGVYSELQAGSYVFLDADYARNHAASGSTFAQFEHSLFILATVMSRPVPERAVCDVGHKASSSDSGYPTVPDIEGATYVGASDEHGVLRLERPGPLPALGDKVRLIPGHCDPTVNLHDWFVGVRAGRVESLWPISGRGPGF